MKKFSRKQLQFIVEIILTAALDRIESNLPSCINWDDRQGYEDRLISFNNGAIETCGMALACLYAKITGDGLGIGDALVCAGRFDDACDRLIVESWKNEGKRVKKRMKKLLGTQYQIHDYYPGLWPNVKWHATQFVSIFDDYKDRVQGNIDLFGLNTPETEVTSESC